MTRPGGARVEVPDALVAWHLKFFGERGRAWIDAAPELAAGLIERWRLQPDGAAMCGAVALVLPVLTVDGTPAALKLQPVDDHTGGEPDALRAWNGNGAVRLLDHDRASGSMLLERLDADRPLATVRDEGAALQILSELLARLSSVPAPAGLRRLSDVAADMLERVPVPRTIRRRFDLMTDVVGLDRPRATRWTLARILENMLWDVEHDDTIWHSQPDRAIAEILLDRAG